MNRRLSALLEGRDHDPDRRAYRRSAISIGLRVAAVSAALVCSVVVLFVAYVVWQLTPGQQVERHGPEDVHVWLDTVDLLIAVLTIGVFAIVLAGVATWLIATHAVRPLGEAHRLQRTFVADAGHELRTPLTVVSARVQQLQGLVPADGASRGVVDALRGDVDALVEIVDDLLATAAGRTTEGADASLEDALHDAVGDVAVLAQERAVQLVVSPGDAVVRVPATQLRRSLVALLDNAVGHSPSGGAVWVDSTVDAREVVVRVRDEGGGITGIAPRRVFDRFAHGAPPPGAPTRTSNGIGLALVREVAVRAGGDVRVERTGRDGTVFALRLPTVDRVPAREQASSRGGEGRRG